MKKTLFALLACATLAAPAMAANWEVRAAEYAKYGNNTTKDDYTLYLYQDPSGSITSVTSTIADMTLSEFTALAGTGYAFAQEGDDWVYAGGWFATTLPISTPAASVWGVCVYNGGDGAFLVAESDPDTASILDALQYNNTNGGDYASFKAGSPATPEPATATLSLLALAGMASRRRRK